MRKRVQRRLKFVVERLMLRGAQYRLLLIAALIGLLSVAGGGIIYFLDGRRGSIGDAIWWAFLRLSDPGYLGDDVGMLQRFVATILTVLGYVVFVGALVAIMTQWLNERMRMLAAGLTPITQADHILLVGWSNRTATIVRELVLSQGRVRRFLRRHGARRLRIAILAEEVTAALRIELRDRLAAHWNERQVILRTGSPLRLEHLRRVDFLHAAAVILPAADFASGGAQQADTRAIKTLLSMTNHPQLRDGTPLPLAVVEIFDARKTHVALHAYDGPIEILASDAIISRLIAQNVRHSGLSHVYGEVLKHGNDNEIYIRDARELAGRPFGTIAAHFPHAVVLGIVRPDGTSFHSLLNPPADLSLQPDDRVALLARSYTAAAPDPSAPATVPPVRIELLPPARTRPRRVLVLGWNHKVPALIREFDSYVGEQFTLDLVSAVSVHERQTTLAQHEFAPTRVNVQLIECDYTVSSDLRRLEPAGYDNIVLLGSDWIGSGEESDARTIVGYLLLRELLPRHGGPAILVELLDEANVSLFRRRTGEVLISPRILSHMLAQVALRQELRSVFDELFGPAGAEIVFRQAAEYDLAGRESSFQQVEERARAHGEIALGVRPASAHAEHRGGVVLNPPRDRRWTFTATDEIVAVTNAALAGSDAPGAARTAEALT
jgi:ion channel POLLUX/CASTOR